MVKPGTRGEQEAGASSESSECQPRGFISDSAGRSSMCQDGVTKRHSGLGEAQKVGSIGPTTQVQQKPLKNKGNPWWDLRGRMGERNRSLPKIKSLG